MTFEPHWRWVDRKGVQRVLTTEALCEALRAGVLGRDVPVWREGMSSFEPVARIAELEAWSRLAPASTPANVQPVGTAVAPTPETTKALQQMVTREKSKRTIPDRGRVPTPRPAAGSPPGPSETPTVPPPGRAKKTAMLGSPSGRAGAGRGVTPEIPRPPLPPSPVAPQAEAGRTNVAVPPPPMPPTKTSPAAMTIGAGVPAPPPPRELPDLTEDTPPATPIAITASGRRSSSPSQLKPEAPEPPANLPDPPAPPPAAEPPRDVPTVPPSRMEMTQPSTAMRAEFERAVAREKRMRILIPVAGAAAGVAAVVMLGLVIMLVVADDTPSASSPAAASASTVAPAAVESAAPAAAPDPPPPSKPATACLYRGPRKRLVIGASKDVPLEVWGARDERAVAVGFAARNLTALGFVLDPGTLSPQRSYSKKVGRAIHRVVPLRTGGSISFETNADDPSASVHNPLTVPTDPPLRLGTFKNALTIAAEGDAVPEILWQLPFDVPVEAMRTSAIPGKGFGLVFRAKDALWLGWVGENRKPAGDLHKIPGTGVKVGAPSIGWNGREALITFANLDRAGAAWNIRMARVPFGQASPPSFEWAVPQGGPGGAAIAPTVLGLDDGRWVVVWTEGKSGSRSVRVQTYDAEMLAVGDAFTVSRPGSNAGQGTAVVGSAGGAVLYLAVVGDQYEVWGAGIDCP